MSIIRYYKILIGLHITMKMHLVSSNLSIMNTYNLLISSNICHHICCYHIIYFHIMYYVHYHYNSLYIKESTNNNITILVSSSLIWNQIDLKNFFSRAIPVQQYLKNIHTLSLACHHNTVRMLMLQH